MSYLTPSRGVLSLHFRVLSTLIETSTSAEDRMVDAFDLLLMVDNMESSVIGCIERHVRKARDKLRR